jgi:hypothetical protein
MRKSFLIISIFILTISPILNAQFYYDGNDLLKRINGYERRNSDPSIENIKDFYHFLGYVAGVYDSWHMTLKVPNNFQIGQALAIVAKYVKEHPERLHEPASTLVRDAIKSAFDPSYKPKSN